MENDAAIVDQPEHRQPVQLEGGVSLAEAIYRFLLNQIRTGALRPGERLREEEVAQWVSASRTPVREALGRLTSRRMIEVSSGRGLVVRRLDLAEVLELYAMRELLEGAAARLAAGRFASSEQSLLESIERSFEQSVDDAEAAAQVNRLFHQTIFTVARNRYLNGALAEVQDALPLLGRTTFSAAGRHDDAVHEHRQLMRSLLDGDADASEAAARRHIRNAGMVRLDMLRKEMGKAG